jgi:Zn-dependent M28 family amino/carboxypeptidase
VVSGSWSGPQFDLVRADNNMSRVEVEGWFSTETARGVFAMAGLDLEEMKAAALRSDFEAIPMALTASVALRNTFRRSLSNNVLGLLPGTDRSDEYVIYMAHWDHLGRDPSLEGDQIYNGALDNASGTAALLELAQAFASLGTPPRRSVLFIAVTAEEQGLLGSAYYGVNPVVPLNKTVAAINMDGINTLGPMSDIVVVGYGNSELDDYMAAAAFAQGRVLKPDPEPEKGYYYRSDHFSLAKQGVPAIYTDTGTDHVERGVEWVTEQKEKYTEENYHKPSDEYAPDWDLSGAVQDIQLYFTVGLTLANEDSFPNWTEGTEFRSIRDRMMGSR